MDAAAARPAASLGPRLAGRLTAELISRSPQYMNCVQDYEIDLRGAGWSVLQKLVFAVSVDQDACCSNTSGAQ